MITTPLPYAFLFNSPLPGLTENLRRFDALVADWEGLPLDRRIQALDDAVGILKTGDEGQEQHPVVLRLQREIQRLATASPASADRGLLEEAASAIREKAQTETAPPDGALESFRILTRPTSSRPNALLIRGPAHLLKTRSPEEDLMEEFGKVAARLWDGDRMRARKTFRALAFPDAVTGAMQLSVFSTTRRERDIKRRALAQAGFDVRSTPVPADFLPYPIEPKEFVGDRGIVHWTIGVHRQMPLERWFREFIDLMDAARPHPIVRLDVLDRTDVSLDDPELDVRLLALFGRPISAEDIRQAFAIDVPGYITRHVSLQTSPSSGSSLLVEIAADQDDAEVATRLSGRLPPPPPLGTPWIAWGDDLSGSLKHYSQGIARRALARILVFLHRVGVNALDMMARHHGLAFLPHIGFDFRDEEIRDRVTADLAAYLIEREGDLSSKMKTQLLQIQRAWEVLDFQNERGEPVGRDFLAGYARQGRMMPLRFWLNGIYPGWRRLFARQLQDRPELDIRTIPTVEPRSVHRLIMERVEALMNTPPPVDPSLPLAVRRQSAEQADMLRYLLDELERAQSSADRDSLTDLLTRRAFLRHNTDLERGLTNPRKGERPEHWVLMVDIDHFKKINDSYGHHTGDEAIRCVAQILKDCFRDDDLICRWGGEEFAIVLRGIGPEDMRKVAERIRERIAASPLRLNGGGAHPFTVSIGAAPFQILTSPGKTTGEPNPFQEEAPETVNSLTVSLQAADQNLYKAKQTGRNRVVYPEGTI